jgi:hypothetical protein
MQIVDEFQERPRRHAPVHLSSEARASIRRRAESGELRRSTDPRASARRHLADASAAPASAPGRVSSPAASRVSGRRIRTSPRRNSRRNRALRSPC